MNTKALRVALDVEQRGHDYYEDIAAHAENPLTKAAFTELAAEELQHMECIRQLYDETGAGKSSSLPQGTMEDTVRRLFKEFEGREREAWKMDNAAAYEHATALERESYALYSRLANETESQAEREFFRKLMEEELIHLSALQNVSNYLTHTGDWFASEETHVWNWMNM